MPKRSPLPTTKFLSTPSVRRATLNRTTQTTKEIQISIHALREEGDIIENGKSATWAISIHALREEGDSS